jgi:hypothetical protein
MVLVVTGACSLFILPQKGLAFDLTGAWAASADKCSKTFTRQGRAKTVGFAPLSRGASAGFIAEAGRLRSKRETCIIKSRKGGEETINLIVACASGVMLSNVQIFLKVIDDATITREFPGMDGADVTYHRCHIS